MLCAPFLSKEIAREDTEGVGVDNDVASNFEVAWVDEVATFFDFVLAPFQELALLNPWILLRRLEDTKGVISQIDRDNESALDIFRHSGIQLSSVA